MRIPRPRELWSHLMAKRRGEVKVAPYGNRGRIYQRKGVFPEANDGNRIKVKAEPKITIRAKVIRTNGTVEDRGIIAEN